MAKIFRKIRSKLLRRGETGKYLKYAIGEILLVVIGILIALQINNWSESNKQREHLLGQLAALSLDLEKDMRLMEKDAENYSTFSDYFHSVRNGVYDEIDPTMFLKRLVTNVSPRDFGTNYNNFKPHLALNLLPDSLTNSIINHYEVTLVRHHYTADFHRTFVSDHIESFIVKNCRFEPLYKVDSIAGYDLMRDENFQSYVSYQEGAFGLHAGLNEISIQDSRMLRNSIEAYLREHTGDN